MYALGVALQGASEHYPRPDAEGEPQCTRDRLVILSKCFGAMLTSFIVFLTFLPARYPAIPHQLRPDKRASPLMASPQISRSDLA